MTSLRRAQARSYWADSTPASRFRDQFALPESESPLADVHAVLSLKGKPEAYSGKLYLSQAFLTFTSLDRRSCRLSLPLATVRRVEKLAPGQDGMVTGAFALSLTLLNGVKLVLQLNSLRTTNDQFCAILKTQLKAALPLMKQLKPFARTFFSEFFLNPDRDELDAKKKEAESAVGELISFGDDGAKDKLDDAGEEWSTKGGLGEQYHGGLGLIFKYPGDPRKLREKSKMKLWKDYLQNNGRNLTLIRYPTFTRLVQVGLPNRLRGELWELTCGSMYLRLQNPGVYEQILKDNAGRTSASTEDIEKDLHRSLPEYAAYQDKRGIDTMRRVLTAYSWSNPELGYCQAMNLVVASFLIYMSEEQCFWCLTVLCDRLLPGYYSPSMYGTVLDQRVFEHLVERTLPILHEHFITNDVQLSVASLPWFLSLFISSLPMVFAFRIIDCFFLMGPKVLFQVGLAILKINGEELLSTTDDGAFINIMKRYFASLGDSAHPGARDPRTRQITKFQELLVVAFREFSTITDDTIASERKRFRAEVVVSIEDFAKRTTLRNLRSVGRLDKARLGLAYDHFQFAILKSKEAAAGASTSRAPSVSAPGSPSTTPKIPPPASGSPKEGQKPEVRIDRNTFGTFIGGIATWARDERLVRNGFHEHVERTAVEHELIDRIFVAWDFDRRGALSFQDVVLGLDSVVFNDLMTNLSWIFSVHDKDGDGYLTKDEILQLSESLLFIFRNEPGDRYLGSVSNLMQNLFEAAETTKPDEVNVGAPDAPRGHRRTSSAAENPHRPYLGLSTFRMCILADPLLEDFFASDLTNSWRLEILIAEEKPKQPGAAGWFGGLVKGLMTDENKERFNRLADQVGKRLDIHQVEALPSIGKLSAEAAALEPMARDGGLFSTSSSRNTPKASPQHSPEMPHPLSAAAMRMPAYPPAANAPSYPTENPWADVPSSRRDIDIEAAAAQAFERPQFVLDDAGEGEDEDYGGEGEGEGDDQLMQDVDDMLADDDQGVTGGVAIAGQELLSRDDGKTLF
ncbi:GTPase activating protein [Pseudohyphozyma bogoriensis]|nr:GTPase activating protein [Pseudohyphozyma bogoriensis]